MRRLLAFLDPWLRRPALVVKPHDGTILERKIRQNEADAREPLADVVLDFRHDPSGRGPALRPIPETLVPDQRPVARSSRRTKQEVFDLDLQVLVCWHPDRVLDGTCLQGVVDLRCREGRVGADRHPPALGLLPLNLRHQQRVSVVGTVDVTGTQLRRQTVAVVVAQQQRVVAD